jgi:hypothetical protein
LLADQGVETAQVPEFWSLLYGDLLRRGFNDVVVMPPGGSETFDYRVHLELTPQLNLKQRA